MVFFASGFMIPDCSPAVARAMDAAQQLARSRNGTEVVPLHLLCALLEEEEGQAASLLREAGAAPAAVRGLAAAGPANGLPAGPPVPLALTVQQAIDRAQDLAPDSAITSEQLLLALLHEDQDLRQKVQQLGMNWETLQARLPAELPPVALDEPLDLLEPTHVMQTGRILDACANRAREGLRVVEDYCRFVLEDPFLSGELKRLRHDLTEALSSIPEAELLEARDTPGDVGTSLSTVQEGQRDSLLAVAQANWKRLQEALRSLEEFGKLRGPHLGRAFEQLRYRTYTLEQAIIIGTTARQRLADARLLVLLTGSACLAALDWTIREAAAGGAQIFQLREKELGDCQLLERARNIRRWTRETGTLFIMNDRPDIARLAEADGVHLGQDDMPVAEARRILGPGALIGVSTHDIQQVRQAILDGASYIGVGPTFPSATKEFTTFPGLDFVKQALAETSLPAFVIGGVNERTIAAAVAAGANRVAVSQAVCQAEEPRAAAAALRECVDRS